ncbi:pyrroline-5-carboxylate reductase family protein [Pseudothioclava arenosa]|uniref:Pyrroline-5-carboxylate reductase n=1 Tax=Pseudothioclava arenosa TaxID=1795308 RepID=A0A2A4CUC3_9RHOB|nr:pyrroline-5-carboxylate reductase dimerization domain-containing protein [Pseudothioclava arenosa]PCD77749.1 NADP oxidoreductase [Pseudothioclava arenosa]
MKIGIIGGCGWIGAALGRALVETGTVAAPELIILRRDGRPGTYFGHAVSWARDAAELVERADVIIVSVRPEDWPALALEAHGKLVISMMAGVPISALGPRSIRAMPNAAAEIRAGYTPWVAGPAASPADKAQARAILSVTGGEDELTEEDHLDLMTALSGSGSAYPALMAVAMMEFLRAAGLSREVAERAAEAVICDAAQLLKGKMHEAPALVQAFIDYAGTTAVGLNKAEEAGFSRAIQAALEAATERAREMRAD